MSLQLYIAFFPTEIPAAVYCRLKDSPTLWTPAGAFAALVSATRLNLSVLTPIMPSIGISIFLPLSWD